MNKYRQKSFSPQHNSLNPTLYTISQSLIGTFIPKLNSMIIPQIEVKQRIKTGVTIIWQLAFFKKITKGSENVDNFYLKTGSESKYKFHLFIGLFVFSAQWPEYGEVQLPDSDSDRTSGGRNRRCELGQADRTGAVQIKTRPLSSVLPRWTATTPGGDGTKTRQVKVLHHTDVLN